MRMMAKAAVAAAFLCSMTFGAAARYYVPGGYGYYCLLYTSDAADE